MRRRTVSKTRKPIDRELVAQLGQPVLRAVADEVSKAEIGTPEFQAFIEHMHQVLLDSGGVGLAAPQVFRSQRIFLAALPDEENPDELVIETLINPRLSNLSPEMEDRWEGCLSFIELMVLVPRHSSLVVDYLDLKGTEKRLELSGFPARVVQHESDHLDGVLTIDRARSPRHIIKASELDDVVEPID
jgi:peptide deformylase